MRAHDVDEPGIHQCPPGLGVAGSSVEVAHQHDREAVLCLVGQSLSAALAALEAEELQLVGVEAPDESCESVRANPPIITQSLAPGEVPQGSTVELGYCAG